MQYISRVEIFTIGGSFKHTSDIYTVWESKKNTDNKQALANIRKIGRIGEGTWADSKSKKKTKTKPS